MVSFWVAIVLLLVVGSFCALRLYKRVNLIEEKFTQQTIALHHELMVINEAAMGVGKRLINTEKKLRASIEKQQHFATVTVTVTVTAAVIHVSMPHSNKSHTIYTA